MNSVAGCAWNGLRNNARSVLNKEMSSCWTSQKRWATKRSGGSTKNGRDSISKRLGVKRFGGENVVAGNIIIRQRGTKYHPGSGVGIGRDHTIFSTKPGTVSFQYNRKAKHQIVSVL